LSVITDNFNPSLVTQGWDGEKPYLVSVDTETYVTEWSPDIAAGWPEEQPNHGFTL
jgi:hypothetical protein